MTPDLIPIIVTAVVTTLISVPTVYAANRNGLVKSEREEKLEWKAKYASAREEIHLKNGELHAAQVRITELQERTNFAPVDARITALMNEIRADRAEQKQVNEASIHALQAISSSQEHLSKTLVEIMKKLVPDVPEAELKEQETPL